MTQPYSIEQVLPHRGQMLLLERLCSCTHDEVVTELTIRADSTFCDGHTGVPAWVGMEYMAQTASAYAGCNEVRMGQAPSISLLLGTRAYHATTPVFALGAQLRVHARLEMRDSNDLAVFACRIMQGERELARGDIKAIRPTDVRALIEAQSEAQRNE